MSGGVVPKGRPIPILVPRERSIGKLENENSREKNESPMFELDEKALEEILLQEHIKDCIAVVVSVVGTFRKGKSFLLDFFLRYLNFMYRSPEEPNTTSWLGDENTPLRGFSWRGGSQADTAGILIWSEVFRATLPTGDEVAIILLDTQGTSDSRSTDEDDTIVFALSTMLSSIQVYNLSQNIEKSDLQHLDYFAAYGSLALERTGDKPFQKLQFLIRDWSSPKEANYGEQGGARKLESEKKKASDKQLTELNSMWNRIDSCFAEISCFLMPHPGLKVSIMKADSEFDGRLSEIDQDFKHCLQTLVPLLLSPEHLVPKEVNGERITIKDLVRYWKSYVNMFNAGGLPKPKSIFEATAEANNLSAVAAARKIYNKLMDEACSFRQWYLSTVQLEAGHKRCYEKALEYFHSKRKMGGDEHAEFYRAQLEMEIQIDFDRLKKYNESQTSFSATIQWFHAVAESIVEVVPWRPVLTVIVLGLGGVFAGVSACIGGTPFRTVFSAGLESAFVESAENIITLTSWRTVLGLVGASIGGFPGDINSDFEEFKIYRRQNFSSMVRTPMNLMVNITTLYVLSSVFDLIGLHAFAKISYTFMWTVVFILATWSCSSYDGQDGVVGRMIERIATFTWEGFTGRGSSILTALACIITVKFAINVCNGRM